jgi:GcrA cell cycle regulator
MQSAEWAREHSEALRKYLARGMSFAEAAEAINAKFRTAYSRSAAIGRAKRMGFAAPDRPKDLVESPPQPPRIPEPRERHVPKFIRVPIFERAKPVRLRCVGIVPRHLSLIDLEAGDCRYPFGGDEEGEAITFCGYPRRHGSSYCTAHFHLTCGLGTRAERAAGAVSLRLVEVA